MKLTDRLLSWYDEHKRELPWRQTTDPYKIWISEIILQQTRVAQGYQYYLDFLQKFPDLQSLYNASGDEVLLAWQGLGYYSRAQNLHAAAKQIVEDYNGVFPDSYEKLLTLKGVGPYTAAAIASLCYGAVTPAVDGNFYRVLSRIFADEFDISATGAFRHFTDLAMLLIDAERPADFNQAVMDLGGSICRPKNPLCVNCPVNDYCLALKLGRQNDFPVKNAKAKVVDLTLDYYFVRHNRQFLIRKRDASSFWRNLYEFVHGSAVPESEIVRTRTFNHKLSHRNLTLHFHDVPVEKARLKEICESGDYLVSDIEDAERRSFPRPFQRYLEDYAFADLDAAGTN